MFYFDNIGGKKILKSSLLSEFEPDFKHLFTTKESFIKTKEPNLINTANSNLEMVLGNIGAAEENFYRIKQTHGTNIVINPKTTDIIEDTDGIILSNPNTATVLHFADCTPVLLYDPKNRVAAGLHAGWRGTAGGISRKGVRILKEKFGSKPKDIIAAIGPCIGQEDFETGMEVYEALNSTLTNSQNTLKSAQNTKENRISGFFKFKETPKSELTEGIPRKLEGAKVFPDLAKINAAQLLDEGVETIDICHFKTYKNNDILFSYRRENKTTNRISMVFKIG